MGLFHTTLIEIDSLIRKGEIAEAQKKLEEHVRLVNRGTYGTLIQNMQGQLSNYTRAISGALSELEREHYDICLEELERAILSIRGFKANLGKLIQDRMIKLE